MPLALKINSEIVKTGVFSFFLTFFFIFLERDQEIYMNNKILLHKMEKIDGKAGVLNPLNLAKQSSGFQKFHQFGVLSKRINYHKTIENENMVIFFWGKNLIFFKNFLKRLHSAKTLYGKQKFNKEFLQSEVYRKNTSKYNKSNKKIFFF